MPTNTLLNDQQPERQAGIASEAVEPRIGALGAEQDLYRVAAVLAVADGKTVEDLAGLYWAVATLDPLRAEFEDDVLVAHFNRRSPNADVAAWEVAGELSALPDAEVKQVEAVLADGRTPEVVLLAASTLPNKGVAA